RVNAGGITVGGDLDFSTKGNDNLVLNATAGSIAGGAGRITTTGNVSLSGIGIGTVANPVLLNLGGTGTLTAVSSGTGAAADISISENSAAGLKMSQLTNVEGPDPSSQTFTIKQTGAGGIIFDVDTPTGGPN